MNHVLPDKQIQQSRSILGLLGITWWMDKNKSVKKLTKPALFDRFTAESPDLDVSQGSSSKDVISADVSAPIDAMHHAPDLSNEQNNTAGNLVNHNNIQPNQNVSVDTTFTNEAYASKPTDSKFQKTPSNIATPFVVQGLRYQNWLFFVWYDNLTPAEQDVWHSLKNALFNKASSEGLLYDEKQFRYPMVNDTYKEDSGLNPAQFAFEGFVISFTFTGNQITPLFLSAMPNDCILPNIFDHTRGDMAQYSHLNLKSMTTNQRLKLEFWQLIHG